MKPEKKLRIVKLRSPLRDGSCIGIMCDNIPGPRQVLFNSVVPEATVDAWIEGFRMGLFSLNWIDCVTCTAVDSPSPMTIIWPQYQPYEVDDGWTVKNCWDNTFRSTVLSGQAEATQVADALNNHGVDPGPATVAWVKEAPGTSLAVKIDKAAERLCCILSNPNSSYDDCCAAVEAVLNARKAAQQISVSVDFSHKVWLTGRSLRKNCHKG